MIREGDLVAVVRCCCPEYVQGHWIFRVEFVHGEYLKRTVECAHCARELPLGYYGAPAADMQGAPLSWLKKIPPLDEKADEKREEGVEA